MNAWNRLRALLGKGSPYRPFMLVALGLATATLVLLSLQGIHGPAPASSTATTATADLREPESPAPSAPPAPTRVTKPRPLSPAAAVPAPSSFGAARASTVPGPETPEPVRSSAAPTPASSGPAAADIETEIIRLTNDERAAEELPPLTHDPALDKIARAHSRDMLARGFFSHENPDGDGPTERAEKAGYNTHKKVGRNEMVGVGENIGMMPLGSVEDIGFVEREARSIAAAQVRGWMDNRGHRSNILSEDYERIGVGVVYDGKGAYICTQVFW
jgi:uncharacterized protein YkwD